MHKTDMLKKAISVWDYVAGEITRLASSIDADTLSNIITMIANCTGRIVTTGVGTSAVAARKFAHSLSCIERPSFYLSPGDAIHGALGAAQPGDIAVLISKGGGTAEILHLLPGLKAKAIPIIGVTENAASDLALASDLILNIKVQKEADPFNMLATTSTMAVIAAFDAICIILMEYTGYTKDQFAIIHPAGSVGERLTAETKEL